MNHLTPEIIQLSIFEKKNRLLTVVSSFNPNKILIIRSLHVPCHNDLLKVVGFPSGYMYDVLKDLLETDGR